MRLSLKVFSCLLLINQPILAATQGAVRTDVANRSTALAPIVSDMTVGTALQLIKVFASAEDMQEISKYLKKVGVKNSDKVPSLSTSPRGVSFDGERIAYDLSKIEDGQIYNGGEFWRFNTEAGWSKNYAEIRRYVSGKTKTSASQYFFLPQANATLDDGIEEMRQNRATAGKFATKGIGLLGTFALVKAVALLMKSASLASAPFILGYSGILALSGLLYLITSSSLTAFERYGKNGVVVCKDGHVGIRMNPDKPDEMVDSKFSNLKFSNVEDIGTAELKARQFLCENPKVMATINKWVGSEPVPSSENFRQNSGTAN